MKLFFIEVLLTRSNPRALPAAHGRPEYRRSDCRILSVPGRQQQQTVQVLLNNVIFTADLHNPQGFHGLNCLEFCQRQDVRNLTGRSIPCVEQTCTLSCLSFHSLSHPPPHRHTKLGGNTFKTLDCL